MTTRRLPPLMIAALLCSALAAQKGVPAAPNTPYWQGYGRDSAHTAVTYVHSQPLNQILWQTPVDQQPQYTGSSLLIHYASPLITTGHLILVTVKTGVNDSFQVEARHPVTGALMWTETTDWVQPPHGWGVPCGSTLTPQNKLATPAAGGTILLRDNADLPNSAVTRVAFFGLTAYQQNQAAYDSDVAICTPITSDSQGNLYFGFRVANGTSLPLSSGLARISSTGVGSWIAAGTAANSTSIRKVVYNCTPAIANGSVYVAVNSSNNSGGSWGYLLKLDPVTLTQQARIRLKDVDNTAQDALLLDDGTASPMVGPDGDVYFGVFEYQYGINHYRGWLRHYDATLTVTKPAGPFGWDDTASVVPRSMVPQYTGTSNYLVLTKYNNYGGGAGGNGLNKLGVFDPNATMIEPITGAIVMNNVLEILGPTPDPTIPGGVREWCINTAAIDVLGKSAIVNCEDGKCYRWYFPTNSLTEVVTLTAGIGEAYTPTILGPTGISYAMNNATLYALGK